MPIAPVLPIAPVAPPVAEPKVALPAGKVLFEIGNLDEVEEGPRKGVKFTLDAPHVITLFQTYHWNQGLGAAPGTLALKGPNKTTYGPWPAVGSPGQGGASNAYWTVRPYLTLPAGSYTAIDSDPSTWSHNGASGNRGFTRIEGYPAGSGQTGSAPVTGNDTVDNTVKKIDDTVKKLEKFLDIFK